MIDDNTKERINSILPLLNENQKRKYLAAESKSLGWGGASAVSDFTGVTRKTIQLGMKELESGGTDSPALPGGGAVSNPGNRIRKPGAGRKDIETCQPGITDALMHLVNGHSFGSPETPLQWTTKSLRNLADELGAEGFRISYVKVGQLLESNGFSLQINQKMMQVGKQSPDRDAQFGHINKTVAAYMDKGQPVISVDCKKKENIGNFKNNGAEYAPVKQPVKVLDHDFPIAGNGKAVPYGIYDINRNEGYVNVGVSSDTAQFAVHSIEEWWQSMGRECYPEASTLYICADGGGSNGSRNKLWKKELQGFADRTGIAVEISHFPPGTSKWNKIEHRMFSQISKNWRGRPLETIEIVVSLIASTTTETGLNIKCGLDRNIYQTGIKVSDKELESVNLIPNEFHGEWNYRIIPHT